MHGQKISQFLCNPWVGTALETLIIMGQKREDAGMKKILNLILEEIGFKVTKAETSIAPYDLIIENPENTTNISIEGVNKDKKYKKVEVKVSMSGTDHTKCCVNNLQCIINHVGLGTDFHILLMIFMIKHEEEALHLRWCTGRRYSKTYQFTQFSIFKNNKSGKKGDNDDWICSGKTNIKKLLEDPLFKTEETSNSVL